MNDEVTATEAVHPTSVTPLVSIVIPCYRGEAYLSRALDSCLLQTYATIEVIVVNDASPDRCLEMARDYQSRDPRVHVEDRRCNGGVAEAFNTGYRAARGDYLTRLAQDDLFKPSAVETMAGYLGAHPDVGLTYADMELIDDSGAMLGIMKAEAPEKALYPVNRLGLCVMWRREVLERIGEFDPRCDAAEDYDYWLRASRHFRFGKCCDEVLLSFRYHSGQNSVLHERKQKIGIRRALLKQRIQDVREGSGGIGAWQRLLKAWIRFVLACGVGV